MGGSRETRRTAKSQDAQSDVCKRKKKEGGEKQQSAVVNYSLWTALSYLQIPLGEQWATLAGFKIAAIVSTSLWC